MKITEAQVEYVALLARLALSPQEKALYLKHLNSILDYMDKLNEIDTEEVEPTSHVLTITNVMKDDIVEPGLGRAASLANAPDHEGGHLRVPKILD